MSKHNLITANVEFKKGTTIELLEYAYKASNKNLFDYPVNYILFNDKSMYIGESTQVKTRLKSHLDNPSRKSLENVLIFYEEKFNQSATFNIETNLINYMIADSRYKLQNVSQTKQKVSHNYYNKNVYDQEIFESIWDYLMKEDIVNNSLEFLRNTDVFKLSPYKELNSEQIELKYEVLKFIEDNIRNPEPCVLFIEGDAGTGKSVLLSSIFNTIQDYSKNKNSNIYNYKDNYMLVNHSEMLKTYRSIAKQLPNLLVRNFEKPTSFINKSKKHNTQADIVLVDEAHLLLTQSDNFNYYEGDNHLIDIMERSKITIAVFDPKQVLKVKSYWNDNTIKPIKSKFKNKTIKLNSQMRIHANNDVIQWMDNFVDKKITPLPKDDSFDIRIFDDVQEMYELIKEKNKKYGLSRIVSTFDFEHKKDGKDYFVEIGDFKLPWNRTNENYTWAENEESINEVGSIYTIQGFDLNYVGVILGPSVQFDKSRNEVFIDSSKYKDTGAFSGSGQLDNKDNIQEEIILNSINVLIKRGIKGLYIYAVDKELQYKLLSI